MTRGLGVSAARFDRRRLSEQALVVYRAMHEQISFLKKQQWTITNYLLLVYGAAYAIKKEVASSSLWWVLEWVLVGGVAVACLYGLCALMIVQWDLKCARMRVSKVDEGIFGITERAHLQIKPEKHPFRRGLFFTGALGLVLVFGAVVVISYLI
jgi:hypothetical protein